jgi:hypothetical protein
MAEFEEANLLFSRNEVSKRHLSKLYGPGDVLVTSDATKPVAYLLEASPVVEGGANNVTISLAC